ncbi:hypothetical protein BDN72DRAFT_858869 [Pluteus cervinus]|uniref:Uncharacterized protein n=1 Tax=Pluteus cervinus TaxID=181527 RepID=A0ACD3AQ32_9AGAR|nr:hypothetical protein BDN72DRAFT_858869 [Pluteus cervinus]
MPSFARLLSLVSLAAIASAAAIHGDIVVARDDAPLSYNSATDLPPSDGPDLSTLNPTDSDTIASTAQQVDQKTGPTDDAPPSSDVPPTVYNSDATYNPQYKCAAYGDTHTAAEKTNFGGQQLLPPPAGVSYVQQSVGYASATLVDPSVPAGYQLVFGPTNGANQAPGYMGFSFLDKYDVQACANLCNTRGADSVGGVCQYFNIWRALVNGNPTTYTCSFYYLPTDASTATNTGQGNLQVTYSRGYQRISTLLDGGFEDCGISCESDPTSDDHWVATSAGSNDAVIAYRDGFGRTGHSLGVLGSIFGEDALSGTITTNPPIPTIAGIDYVLQFFHQSIFMQNDETNAVLTVFWNGVQVLSIHPGAQAWTPYQVAVTAVGSDVLSFTGGSWPAYDFLDDISLFLA